MEQLVRHDQGLPPLVRVYAHVRVCVVIGVGTVIETPSKRIYICMYMGV